MHLDQVRKYTVALTAAQTKNFNSFHSCVYRKHRDVLFLGDTSSSDDRNPQNGECLSAQLEENGAADSNSYSALDSEIVTGPDMKKQLFYFF